MAQHPTRTLATTPTDHLADHNDIFGPVHNLLEAAVLAATNGQTLRRGASVWGLANPTVVNVVDYGASHSASAAANSTAIQAAANAVPLGGVLLFPPTDTGYTIYDVLTPITIKAGTVVKGPNPGGSGYGVGVRVGASAVGATWVGKGVFTSETYLANTASGPPGDPIIIEDLDILGRSLTVGNGIVLQNKFSRVNRCFIGGFHGTGLWDPAANTGTGYGIVLSGGKYNSAFVMNAEAPEQRIQNCRLATTNARIYIQDGTGSYTDGFLRDNIIIKQPTGGDSAGTFSNLPDVFIDSAGGWHISGNHWNHSGGDSLVMNGSMSCRIEGNYFDSWGHVSDGGTHYCIDAKQTSSGGGSNIAITDNVFRWQEEIDPGGALTMLTGTLVAVRLRTPTLVGAVGSVYTATISGNDGYVQTAVGGPTAVLFDLRGDAANSIPLEVSLVGNSFVNPNTGAAGDWNDLNVFASGASSLENVTLLSEGNSWNRRAAAPTVGKWAVGEKRWRDTPLNDASGLHLGWICTVAGSPGTWVEMLIPPAGGATIPGVVVLNTAAPAGAVRLAAATEWPDATVGRKGRADLTNATQYRLFFRIGTTFGTSGKLAIQFSTDETNWFYMNGTAHGTAPAATEYVSAATANTSQTSAWTNLATAAKADVHLRVVSLDGDNTNVGTGAAAVQLHVK